MQQILQEMGEKGLLFLPASSTDFLEQLGQVLPIAHQFHILQTNTGRLAASGISRKVCFKGFGADVGGHVVRRPLKWHYERAYPLEHAPGWAGHKRGLISERGGAPGVAGKRYVQKEEFSTGNDMN